MEETEGCPNGGAFQRSSIVEHQATFRDYRLQNPSRHHEGDQSGGQCQQGEFSGENREKYSKNILNFKLLNTSKQKVFTGMIEAGEVSKCVHYRRLEADRRVPPSAAAVTKRGDEKEAYLATQDVEDNDFVVGTNPGNTNIVTIAAPKRAEDANNGNLRQKDMRLLRFS
jgi:hypothetical protein